MKALKELYPDQEFTVKARLMMADKSKVASVDGLNQMFRIYKNGDRSYAQTDERAWTVAGVVPEKERVLTAFDVDQYCDMIIAGETGEQGKPDFMEGMKFEQFVEVMSKHYCERTIAMTTLGTKCFKCPFHREPGDKETLRDGYRECWKEMAKFTDDDFDKPLLKDLSGRHIGNMKGKILKNHKYFMDEITYDDLKKSNDPDAPKEHGLDNYERKWLQIAIATGKEELLKDFETDIKDGVYVDTDGLRKEMAKWKFPLHFIDFETSRSALPFYKGLRPYEQIAFQFSHHKVEMGADGEYMVTHQTQYINAKKGFFPNFEFVRQLKKAVGEDEGTIFRYMDHENGVLNDIRRQLEISEEDDKDELIAFIESITNDAERTMVDIAKSVLRYYYHPSMKGSNSIKDVLPAILNSSELIKSKYSKPVYGTPEMPSLNLENKVWIEYEEDGKPVKDPKTQQPYTVLVDIHEIEALPDGPLKDKYWESIKPYRQMRIPQPDFVLCCNNICNCMTKWYENIARMCNIPLVMIDIPYNNTVEVHDSNVAYVRGQFDAAIKQLEEITGKKFDEKKFEQACANANRTASAWLRVCDYLQYKPAPYSGFDLFNHMADIVTARSKVAAAEAFELLEKDLEIAIKEGTTTTPFPEQYRVMFEGIPCWPKLPDLFKPLKANGVNVTAVVYAPAFGFVFNGLDEMARAYCKAPNSVCIEQGVDWREGICRDNKVDGVLVHYNRSCKPWSGYMAEMQRRFTADLGIPCAGFDGDQADPRNFNAAQYETRVQGLVEAMEQNAMKKQEG